MIEDTYKLLSNSSYGSVLINKSKHTNIRYIVDKVKVSRIINTSTFKSLEENYKSQIHMDNPIQFFFILQYANFRMLQFYEFIQIFD